MRTARTYYFVDRKRPSVDSTEVECYVDKETGQTEYEFFYRAHAERFRKEKKREKPDEKFRIVECTEVTERTYAEGDWE